ncbi:hypothetical protein NBRC10512_007813 [Rhodotorula toruloides]|uniref:RHTO0S01e18008g1_1 n=2 Tax=Rhodotorula toruloides TaxID=5286 RepID=A0A061ALP3_RHOTO|nr:uncharacterized protein RHTO_04230 [Rhodotorula toruloides NP11]EMS19695.1 hypothetical protein RHTO_04230 [Rhodotorula toruloides NP11]CDR36272.1 RHTO0S01e18008g1_1 [Rhodotorula toruloides]
MGQLLTCLSCHGTGAEPSTRQHTPPAAVLLAPLPPLQQPTLNTTSTPGTSTSTFPFSLVHWSSNAIVHTYSASLDPALYHEIHLISSALASHTQYISIVTNSLRNFHALRDPRTCPRSSPPSLDEVAEYLQANFPQLRIWDRLDDAWGVVEKRESANVIYLCEYVMADMDKWLQQPHAASPVERSGHCIIAIIVIAHQLVHAAAKAFFSEDSTPEGLGPESGGDSKVGWAGEGQLFGGYVSLEWAGGFPAFKIDQIMGFFLEDPTTGQQYPIEHQFLIRWADDLRQALLSNATFPLRPINFGTATPAPPPQPGYARVRIATNQRYSPPTLPVRVGTGPCYRVTGGPYHNDPYRQTRGNSEGFVSSDTSD